jgi:hypothetical protein
MQANLRAIIPGMHAVPHADTLADYLARIDVEVIQTIYHMLIRKLLRNKEFLRLVGRITVLIDGSGKGSKDWKYSDKALHRRSGDCEVWMTYVMDASLLLENGMVIPLCTEFLENDGEFDKQDCETKAWHRVAPKLHRIIGGGATIIMDGLYASGPIIMQCRKYNWDYIIVLKDGSIPSFSEDARGIMACEPSNRVSAEMDGRRQEVRWANNVGHRISANNTYVELNVVRMEESWTVHHPVTGKPDEHKKTTYQFISSMPLNEKNALEICMLGRKRWNQEINFKTEKHDGYAFEHYFSLDWDVNKAFYYFMKFGHFVNVMLMSSEGLAEMILPLGGIGKFIGKVKLVFSGCLLDADSIYEAASRPFRWRYNITSIYLQTASPP